MWKIAGQNVPRDRFPHFAPEEMLYEFGGPRIFTLRDDDDELCLAYWCDADDEVDRFIVVSTSAATVSSLKTGRTSVRQALDQPRCWLCDLDRANHVRACWRVEFSDIPGDGLPATGTMLPPELEPRLRFRATAPSQITGGG